jgi:hypothetical protein
MATTASALFSLLGGDLAEPARVATCALRNLRLRRIPSGADRRPIPSCKQSWRHHLCCRNPCISRPADMGTAAAYGRALRRSRTVWDVGRDDPIWCLPLFDPLFECRDGVERKGTIAAEAMAHPGRHEEANGVLRFLRSTHDCNHVVVIIDGVPRGDARVDPAMVKQELASVREEFFQVRIGCRDKPVVQLVGECHIAIEV